MRYPKVRDPFYISGPWKALRLAVLARDLYWCQRCKKTWANTVHHIIPRKERPDLELDPDNCEAVCEKCHNQAHPEKYGGGKAAKPDMPKGIRVIVLK